MQRFWPLSHGVEGEPKTEEANNLIQKQFHNDSLFNLTGIALSVGVLGFIPELVNKHPLKGSDAIHLASALWLKDVLQLGKRFGPSDRSITFATSDKQIKTAGAIEGLDVFDPEEKN
jgi:predicted nucleic acid-binding protein